MAEKEAMTLYELNSLVRELVEINMSNTYKIKAEISEMRLSAKGHCFIELIQKIDHSITPIAKARAVILSDIYPLLKMDFEETTGQPFRAGLEVLLEVKPTFSEIYGYSLIITDIDSTYTLGDMALRRKKIFDRLEREGVAELQKELSLPPLLQRIAIISSQTAAGYGDFCHQLDTNPKGFHFAYKLFPAAMQGNDTEKTIISALDKIANEMELWDVVVIIRGGGAVSDFSGFETYELANSCAQFPLPILTGIGHQRDLTILDLVAHTHLKTPTAVGDFLISQMTNTATILDNLQYKIQSATTERIQAEKKLFDDISWRLEFFFKNFSTETQNKLNLIFKHVCQIILDKINMNKFKIQNQQEHLTNLLQFQLSEQKNLLQLIEAKIKISDPKRILEAGYSLTLKNGKAVTNASEVKPGDKLETILAHGKITSMVYKNHSNI